MDRKKAEKHQEVDWPRLGSAAYMPKDEADYERLLRLYREAVPLRLQAKPRRLDWIEGTVDFNHPPYRYEDIVLLTQDGPMSTVPRKDSGKIYREEQWKAYEKFVRGCIRERLQQADVEF